VPGVVEEAERPMKDALGTVKASGRRIVNDAFGGRRLKP